MEISLIDKVVTDHRLTSVAEGKDKQLDFIKSPNFGKLIAPKYLIIHYTAGDTPGSAINTFNIKGNTSAHLIIDRDGTITQMVPFNKAAFHAGPSFWEGIRGLNNHSIGIELVNAGKLKQTLDGKWITWYGKEIDESELVLAKHKFGDKEFAWQIYPEAQVKAALETALVLVQKYELLGVIGHDDISPDRKTDPGPLFQMASFRARVMGRKEDEKVLFETTSKTNTMQVAEHGESQKNIVLSKGDDFEIIEHEGEIVQARIINGSSKNIGKIVRFSSRNFQRKNKPVPK